MELKGSIIFGSCFVTSIPFLIAHAIQQPVLFYTQNFIGAFLHADMLLLHDPDFRFGERFSGA
jgi:hypothetical protein